MRSKSATKRVNQFRVLRDHAMTIKIQSLARRRMATLKRRRLWVIRIVNLRNNAATKIQSLFRCRLCVLKAKKLAEEKKKRLQEEEEARVAFLESDAATIIQKHYRRCLSIGVCTNRRIELGLHERLLMYLERYRVDGSFFSFVKSINDDYIRYERTITNTIDREERLAKTFVEKVRNERIHFLVVSCFTQSTPSSVIYQHR